MKNIFLKFLLSSLFAIFATSNLYAEDNNCDAVDVAVYTVTIEIGGLPGQYTFILPEQRTVYYDGTENVTLRLSGSQVAGSMGIIVQFQVTPTSSESTKFTVHSNLYNTVIDLDESKTENVQFIVPFNTPSAQIALL